LLNTEEEILGAVRADIERIMARFLEASGKVRWCEKSVATLRNIDLIKKLYPEAKYICLYRNCGDQLISAIETLEIDPLGASFGYEHFFKTANADKVGGLIDYWIWNSRQMLMFERKYPDNCFRITYESFVANPEGMVESLCDFLGEDYLEGLSSKALGRKKKFTPGDHKILSTQSVHSASVDKKGSVSKRPFSAKRLKLINEINSILGYQDFNLRSGIFG